MNAIEVIKSALEMELIDEDGEEIELTLLPGLDDDEIRAFEATLPCKLPEDTRELLRFCSGIDDGGCIPVDFTGEVGGFGLEGVFPHALPIAADGFGNYWVLDLTPESTGFGPIWFACHDAPVILYQSPDVGTFLFELFRMYQPPHESLVDDVHEDRIRNVWRKNPDMLTHAQCAQGSDEVLRNFARELDESYLIIDLRNAPPGDGFSWGRYGPKTVIRRCGFLPIFAYEQKKGRLGKLFGR